MNASYHVDVPAGTAIVLTATAVFLVVLATTGGRRLSRPSRLRRARARNQDVYTQS